MIRVNAVNISRCGFLSKKQLTRVVSSILRRFNIHDAELSIVFATDSEIRPLNKKYRQKDRPTDVLSFALGEGNILGDIVISVERARAQARIFGTSFKNELELYIIHGILHLLGYNDERPAGAKSMRRKEQQLLNSISKVADV